MLLAANYMRYVTLLENFSNELRHACCNENNLDLRRGLFEDLAEFALTDKFAITVLCFEQQVTKFFFPHQLHVHVCLVESVT